MNRKINNLRRVSLGIVLCFFLLEMCTFAGAQTITQNEFLEQLIQLHPQFEKEKLTAQIETKERNSFVGAEDWQLISTAFYAHEEPAIAFASPERSDAFSVSGGVERLFWKTGSRLTASFSSTRSSIKIDPFYRFPSSFYENQFSISYTHPLLKNKNGFLDKLQYDLKQYDIDFSEVQAIENLENFLTSSALKFLDWVYLTEQKEIVQERLRLSEEELTRTQKKREANLIDQADVIRAEDAVRIWKQNLVLIESYWHALQAELAVLTQNNRLYDLSPEFNLYQIEEHASLEETISQLKENSRILQLLNIRSEQLGYSRRGFEETSKPELSLVTRFNTKNVDERLGNSLEMDKPDVTVGLQFRFPLGNRTARSKITKTDLQISQLNKEIEEVTLDLVSAYTGLYIQIKELENVLALNREQIKSAQERTGEELNLYNQGRGELTFVIQSRDNEQNAKLTYAQNALTYHQLIIQSRALMDELYK